MDQTLFYIQVSALSKWLCLQLMFLGHKDNKDNKEEHEDSKHLDHEPPIWGDRLEVLEDLCVSCLNVGRSIFHIWVNSGGRESSSVFQESQTPLFFTLYQIQFLYINNMFLTTDTCYLLSLHQNCNTPACCLCFKYR